MSYTTLEAVKAYGGFDVSEDDDNLDNIINGLIVTAEDIVNRYTDKDFEVDTETDQTYYRSSNFPDNRFDGRTLYFYDWMADAASAVTDSPTLIYLPVTGPPYYGAYLSDGSWAYPSVTFTGYHGYSKEAPPSVEQACIRLVKWLYDQRDSYSGADALITPNGQVLLPGGLPQDVVVLLAPLKSVRLA